RIAIIAMTTSSSISVKPAVLRAVATDVSTVRFDLRTMFIFHLVALWVRRGSFRAGNDAGNGYFCWPGIGTPGGGPAGPVAAPGIGVVPGGVGGTPAGGVAAAPPAAGAAPPAGGAMVVAPAPESGALGEHPTTT